MNLAEQDRPPPPRLKMNLSAAPPPAGFLVSTRPPFKKIHSSLIVSLWEELETCGTHVTRERVINMDEQEIQVAHVTLA